MEAQLTLLMGYLGAVVNNIGDIHSRHAVVVSRMPHFPHHLPLFIDYVPLQNVISTTWIAT